MRAARNVNEILFDQYVVFVVHLPAETTEELVTRVTYRFDVAGRIINRHVAAIATKSAEDGKPAFKPFDLFQPFPLGLSGKQLHCRPIVLQTGNQCVGVVVVGNVVDFRHLNVTRHRQPDAGIVPRTRTSIDTAVIDFDQIAIGVEGDVT